MRILLLLISFALPTLLNAKPCDNKLFEKLIYKNTKQKRVYQKLNWQLLGRSEKRRPICALVLEPNIKKAQKNVYLLGGVHGEEIATPKVTAALALLTQAEYQRRNTTRRVIIVPAFNIDGLLKNRRRNAKGIDLNRDFPTKNARKSKKFKGPRPYGIETRQLLTWFEKYPPYRIISIHQPYHTVGYDGPAKKLAMKMGKLSKYKVTHSWHYSTPGSLGTWAGVERKIPTITLELPKGMSYHKFYTQVKSAVLFAIFDDLGPNRK